MTQAEKISGAARALFMYSIAVSPGRFSICEINSPRPKVFPTTSSIRYGSLSQLVEQGEGVPDHSDFKQAFLDLLEGRAREPFPDGYITGEELGFYLKNRVPMYNPAQHPQYGKIRNPKLDKGDFVFVLPKAGAGDNRSHGFVDCGNISG